MTGAHEGGRPTPPGTGRPEGQTGARAHGVLKARVPGGLVAASTQPRSRAGPHATREEAPCSGGQAGSLSSPREQDSQRWSGWDASLLPRHRLQAPVSLYRGGLGGTWAGFSVRQALGVQATPAPAGSLLGCIGTPFLPTAKHPTRRRSVVSRVVICLTFNSETISNSH